MSSTSASTAPDRAAAAFSAFRSGDRARMAELVTVVTPALWHSVRSVGVDRQEAEDAIQDAFARLVAKADTIEDPQAVMAWLMVTARREAIRSVRKRRATPSHDEALESEVARRGRLGADPLEGVGESLSPAVSELLASERARSLWHHVQTLSPRCRSLLRLLAMAERPDYARISELLGMPVGSIGPTRGRCLAKLRAAMNDDPYWSTP